MPAWWGALRRSRAALSLCLTEGAAGGAAPEGAAVVGCGDGEPRAVRAGRPSRAGVAWLGC